MKCLLIVFSILFIPSTIDADLGDFEYEIDDIIDDLGENIMDKSECGDIHNNALTLVDDIEEALEEESLHSDEQRKLEKLLQDAEALKEITLFFEKGLARMPFKDFVELEGRIGFNFRLVNERFCLPIYRLTFNDYISYFTFKESDITLKYKYKYEAINSKGRGRGERGIGENSFRGIWNNRDAKDVRKIRFNNSSFALGFSIKNE